MSTSQILPFSASVKNNPSQRAAAYADGDPITLFAQDTVTANTTGAPPIAALKNPTPFPIEIHEIKFALGSTSAFISPASIGIQLQIGESLVCSDYVPLWLLDDSKQLYWGETFQNTSGIVYEGTCNYKWVLNTPLILMPGEVLAAGFQNFGLVQTDIDCKILYAGRVRTSLLPVHIKNRVLPAVSFWQGDSLDLSFATASYPSVSTADTSSDELKLLNNADETVMVTKLVGRLVTLNSSNNNTLASDEVQSIIDSMFSVRVRTSHGFELTQGRYIPFRQMFGRDTRSFPGGFELDCGEYVIVDVQANQGTVAKVTNSGTDYYFGITSPVIPQVGIIGERLVNL